MSASEGRKLFGRPRLLQDWDSEAEEAAAQTFELFFDLLLVAAASSIADTFKEHMITLAPWQTLVEFALLYFVTINGWVLYTHHITARFEDSTLANSLVLFIYFFGFGVCIVNSSLFQSEEEEEESGEGIPGESQLNSVKVFAAGAIGQRLVLLWMLASIAFSIQRARIFCVVMCGFIGISMVGLILTFYEAVYNPSIALFGLAFVCIWELFGEGSVAHFLRGHRLIPINIEHTKERMGVLCLIMLGETVLSVTLTYRELRAEHKMSASDEEPYYMALGLSFLQIFMFTLLLFHVQPEPRDHALRRSRLHGSALMILYKLFGLSLLAVGVSVKLVVESVVEKKSMCLMGSRLMGCSVGTSLFLLWLMRVLHHGNKPAIYFGPKMLKFGSDPWHDWLAHLWWWIVGVAWILPFLGVYFNITTGGDPIFSMKLHSGLLFALCVVESSFSHYFSNALPDTVRDEEEQCSEERKALTASRTPSYNAIKN